MGIGSLLLDGIGDTIRVSLTEPPEKEIPVAQALISYIEDKHQHTKMLDYTTNPINPFTYSRFKTFSKLNIGSSHPAVVVADFSFKKEINYNSFKSIGYNYSTKLDKWHIGDLACDYVFVGNVIY